MLPGPVFTFELLTTARRPRYYAVRFAYGLILLFFIWQTYYGRATWTSRAHGGRLTIQEMAVLGTSLFATFMITQIVAVLLLTPAMIAGVIADEKQRKTLHYLLASPLTSAEIVLGKLLARSIHLGVFVAVGLPVISLLTLFGGVDPNLVLLGFAATFTMTYFVAGLSIAISTISRRPREAISLAYILGLSWLFVPPMIGAIMPRAGPLSIQIYEWIKPVNDWIAPSSPFNSIFLLGRMGGLAAIYQQIAWMMGLQLAYGTVLIALGVLQLRPAYRRGDSTPRWVTRLSVVKQWRRILPRPACGEDAMLWKERYVSRTSAVMKIAVGLILLGVGALLADLSFASAFNAFDEVRQYGYGSGPSRNRQEFNGILRFICTALYCFLILGTASAAAGGMTREREEDTWISLIATPLDGTEIVRAKMIGAVWGVRWMLGLLLTFWVVGLALGSVHPLGFLAVAIETPVFVWFASALGTYFSMRSRSSARAMTGTVATLIILNGGYMMCCIPLQTGSWNSMIPAAGVTPMIEALSLANYDEIRRFFTARGPWPGREPDAVATCIIGVLGYAIVALAFTVSAFVRFDIEADRPVRSSDRPPFRPAPKSEIRWVEDDQVG